MLLEIPSDSENNDNIIAQWRPKAGLAEGATVSYAYRQFWCWTPPAHPDLAVAMNSRMGTAGKRRRFVVEFVSDLFADPQKAAEASAAIDADARANCLRATVSLQRSSLDPRRVRSRSGIGVLFANCAWC